MLTEQSLLTFKDLQLHGRDSLHSDDDEDFGARRDFCHWGQVCAMSSQRDIDSLALSNRFE